jgi:hypothetical protein
MVGMSDRLASLQADVAEEAEEPAPLTWHKNPFERPARRSVTVDASGWSTLVQTLKPSFLRPPHTMTRRCACLVLDRQVEAK